MKSQLLIISLILTVNSCTQSDPNTNESGTDELTSLEVSEPILKSETEYSDIIYVPIYSDIYIDANNQSSLLAATLSIRNTSFTDSLFITSIEYFNTDGNMVRSYIENQISLKPMATVNYVVEREDDTGGAGANFVVMLSSKSKNFKPIIQAIMIGQNGNKGFAFSTDGYSIK